VELLDTVQGKAIELDKVLLIGDGDKVTVGKPIVEGAKVLATSQGDFKDKKIIVFKYKPKTRYRRKMGHRQQQTRLVIDKIIEPGAAEVEPMKKPRRRKKEVITNGT
jgi:large subunit ribosomal protein L21